MISLKFDMLFLNLVYFDEEH